MAGSGRAARAATSCPARLRAATRRSRRVAGSGTRLVLDAVGRAAAVAASGKEPGARGR
ncbi:hypothetical protein [Streptomyces sp. WG7]|uniref:hypothetical protein n=1 Tax=Streptomyces sp. WG7 TaxID=3417650 RepID=UPI003CEEE740